MDGVIAWTDAEAQKKKVGADVRGDAVSGMKGPEDSEDARKAAARPYLVLVQDSAVPDGFEKEFSELGPHLHSAASRCDRQGAERDEVDTEV